MEVPASPDLLTIKTPSVFKSAFSLELPTLFQITLLGVLLGFVLFFRECFRTFCSIACLSVD